MDGRIIGAGGAMPVECSVETSPVDQERFHVVDKAVMRHAFDIHNTLGRFCDEQVYQEELAQRCRADGFEVHREVLLRALHQGFAKAYYVDMLVERGVIYELKTVQTLTSSHQKQVINYLLLAGFNHGKLINFRPGSVESGFVSTRLRREDRNDFHMVSDAWQGDDDASRRLKETLCSLLSDWGAFLDVNLYRDALLHFLDGPGGGVQSVDIEVGGRVIGSHKMCTLNTATAWHLSAIRQNPRSYETHLVRLLKHTRLDRIHWINLDHRIVTLQTLKRK